MSFSRLLITAFTAILFTLSCQASAVSYYTLTDLGEITLITGYQDEQNLKLKINEDNLVSGWERYSTRSNSGVRAFSWSNSLKSNPLPVDQFHKLNDLNSLSQYVGEIYTSENVSQAYVWNSDFSTTTLIEALGSYGNKAYAINNNGQVVGTSADLSGVLQGFLWDGGTLTPVTNALSGNNSATAINDNGIVTGIIFGTDTNSTTGNGQAYLWNGSTLTLLNTTNPEVTSSWGADINNSNHIVGGFKSGNTTNNVYPGSFKNDAFFWSASEGYVDLSISNDSITWATAVNDSDQVVGGGLINNTTDATKRRKAILWEGTAAFELNTLVPDMAGWQLQDATDINSSGHIVGLGKLNNKYHGFLLTPIPGSLVSADLSLNATIINTPLINAPLTKPLVKAANRTSTGSTDQFLASNSIYSRAIEIDTAQTLRLEVVNHGPDSASNVNLTFSSEMVPDINQLQPSKGTCTTDVNANMIQCGIPQMNKDEKLIFEFQLQSGFQSSIDREFDATATVIADQFDPTLRVNNSFNEKITIAGSSIVINPVEQNPTTDTGSENNNKAIDAGSKTKSTSSGCTINTTGQFDPVLIFIILMSLLGVYRHSKETGGLIGSIKRTIKLNQTKSN
ncbi:MAG: DUF3466 family protein [Gammaproteobacteria bacterium]|nr:DUF3466 family protein [Gammaproteobacteria bacterium]